jgi:hypothetical protein
MTPGATEHDAYLKAWECESTDDLLTVLRWPDLRPRSVNDNVNQIRYFQENPAKHVWAQIDTSVLRSVVECQSCKATLLLNWGETVDEVGWMAFENWRRRDEKPLRHRPVTLSRAMGVPPIPPHCPGKLALMTEGIKKYRVCGECGHMRSLHVPPEKATAGHYGCMHEDVANGSGGAGGWCSCSGYREVIESSFSGYSSSLQPSDIVAG